MNKIMIPAIPSARYLAVFSLFFCLNTFAAVALEELFAIVKEIYPRRE